MCNTRNRLSFALNCQLFLLCVLLLYCSMASPKCMNLLCAPQNIPQTFFFLTITAIYDGGKNNPAKYDKFYVRSDFFLSLSPLSSFALF